MSPAKPHPREDEPPRSVGALIRLLLRALVKGFVWRLMFAMALGFAVWIAHTYLVVVVNEGFHVSGSAWYRHWLAVRGQRILGAIAWAVPGFVLLWVIRRVLFHPWRFTRSAVTAPLSWWRQARASGLWAPTALLAGGAVGLSLGTWSTSVAWIVGWLALAGFALAEPSRSVSGWLGHLATGRGDGGAALGWMGLCGGLLFAVPLPLQPYAGVLGTLSGAALALPLAVLAWRQPKLAVWLALGLSATALADDGGWREAGGTFDQWVTSTGAAEAMTSGLVPSLATVIAILTALGLPDLPELPELEALLEEESSEDDPDADATIKGPPGWLGRLKDAVLNTFGHPAGQAALDDLMRVLLGVSPGDYGRMMRDNLELLDGGLVRFKNPGLRDAFLDQIGRIGRGIKNVGDALTVFGVAYDTWDNISKGDDWYYGLGKASGAGALMATIADKEPSVAVMEAINWALFGGTDAGEAISPGKNVTGGFNILTDTLTDIANGTETTYDRMHSGHYGQTIQHVAGAAEIAAEAWQDPGTVGEELADFVTADETWQDMYDRNHEVWHGAPPPPGTPPVDPGPLDHVQTAARTLGEGVTGAAIKAGELAARVGQAAGEAYASAEQTWNRWFG